MIKIEMNGPFQLIDFSDKGSHKNISLGIVNPNQEGVYIWGFMYYFDEKGITEPVKFEGDRKYDKKTMKFLPYYVGKHLTNVFKRLRQHQDIRNKDAAKYLRLESPYMNHFFNDSSFPINISARKHRVGLMEFVKKFPKKVAYCNDPSILAVIFPGIKLNLSGRKHTDCPITLQQYKGHELPDTLNELINKMNNFWFCYAITDKSKVNDIEPIIFYSLKGKTVSKTKSFSSVKSKVYQVVDKTSTKIFKNKPSEKFPGY